MRKGYWRTLARLLRAKVASGENQFTHRDRVFSISAVAVEDDVSLEGDGELEFAIDEQGDILIMDIRTSAVILIQTDGQRIALNEELLPFINSLSSLAPSGLELGPAVGEPLDFPSSRRSILGDS